MIGSDINIVEELENKLVCHGTTNYSAVNLRQWEEGSPSEMF